MTGETRDEEPTDRPWTQDDLIPLALRLFFPRGTDADRAAFIATRRPGVSDTFDLLAEPTRSLDALAALAAAGWTRSDVHALIDHVAASSTLPMRDPKGAYPRWLADSLTILLDLAEEVTRGRVFAEKQATRIERPDEEFRRTVLGATEDDSEPAAAADISGPPLPPIRRPFDTQAVHDWVMVFLRWKDHSTRSGIGDYRRLSDESRTACWHYGSEEPADLVAEWCQAVRDPALAARCARLRLDMDEAEAMDRAGTLDEAAVSMLAAFLD